MHVRNFWIEGEIDGRGSVPVGGPKAAGGGFTLRIYYRRTGQVSDPVTVTGRALADGRLRLAIAHDEQALTVWGER